MNTISLTRVYFERDKDGKTIRGKEVKVVLNPHYIVLIEPDDEFPDCTLVQLTNSYVIVKESLDEVYQFCIS